MKILKVCEVVFKIYVSGNDFENPQLITNSHVKMKICSMMRELACKNIFSSLNDHDFHHEIGTEDLHSVQLINESYYRYLFGCTPF